MGKSPVLLCLAMPLAICCAACNRQAPEADQQADSSGVPTKGVERSHKGQPMPAAELYNPDDDKASLAESAGKPLLVNFWAPWCVPCVKELPTLDALSRRPGAPQVLEVSEDIGDRSSVEAFFDKHGIENLQSWRDPEMTLSTALGVQVMPTTVYYDASGHEIWRYVGDLDWTGEEAASLLREGATAQTR